MNKKSTVCTRDPWCVLQAEHEEPCRPTLSPTEPYAVVMVEGQSPCKVPLLSPPGFDLWNPPEPKKGTLT